MEGYFVAAFIGLLVTLIVGSYAYSFLNFKWLWESIRGIDQSILTLTTNHLHHIELRLEALEKKETDGNDR